MIQCFQCYKYGHTREKCREKKICVICDKEYHGQCNGREQCVNCGKKHKSSDRNGEKYQKRLVMN